MKSITKHINNYIIAIQEMVNYYYLVEREIHPFHFNLNFSYKFQNPKYNLTIHPIQT